MLRLDGWEADPVAQCSSAAFVEKVSGVLARLASRPDRMTKNQSFYWSVGR
jgi:hypothetical protein